MGLGVGMGVSVGLRVGVGAAVGLVDAGGFVGVGVEVSDVRILLVESGEAVGVAVAIGLGVVDGGGALLFLLVNVPALSITAAKPTVIISMKIIVTTKNCLLA
jgi:hypothetical protein